MNYYVKLEQLNQLKSFPDKTIYTTDNYYTFFPSWKVIPGDVFI